LWYYFRSQQAPFSVWLSVFSKTAIVYAASVLLFRSLMRRGGLRRALLAIPAAWVSYEFIRNLTTPHGTSGCLAYSQPNFLAFLQLASISGPWVLLLLFPASLAIGLHHRQTHARQALCVAGVRLEVVVLVLIFGSVRLALPKVVNSGPCAAYYNPVPSVGGLVPPVCIRNPRLDRLSTLPPAWSWPEVSRWFTVL
jgi:apolipoprotein N-acyltransferase